MPEAAPAVAPAPTNHPNAPQNGTQPPAQAATTQTKPPAAGEADISAKYKALEETHQKKQREQIIERRKWEATNKANAEKLARLEALEKREQSAKVNPTSYLKSIYGDDWQKVINEAALTGATPAQLVQESIDGLRAEFEAKERARAEEQTKSQAAAQEQAQENARRTIFAECATFYRSKMADYPIFEQVKGGEPAVARMLSARIEHEFHATGKILTTSEVADLIEGEVLEWAAGAMKHEKYKPKLQPVSTSTTVASASKQQQAKPQSPARRSITNDITGSTPAAKPSFRSERERREASEAAFEAARRKG